MNYLEIQSLSHHFGQDTILQDISLSVATSELLCLVGPSGCGKSTLLRLIAGLEKLQSGNILIGGTSIRAIEARKRNIGLVFQHPSLFPHLNVRENIIFGLNTSPKHERKKTADTLLEMIGLTKLENHYPHQLSGGQQQRVALARALAPKPRIMLLDEPFANLDHTLRCEIREEVVGMLKAAKVPTIMVTHAPEEALVMADKIVLLHKNGSLHQIGEPDAIYNHPVDIEAASFFGEINQIKAVIQGNHIVSELGTLSKKEYAPALSDGSHVVIAARQEGLRIAQQNESCIKLSIESLRRTGAGWLIRTTLPSGKNISFHHIYGHKPKKDDAICVTFDSEHIFVYPDNFSTTPPL